MWTSTLHRGETQTVRTLIIPYFLRYVDDSSLLDANGAVATAGATAQAATNAFVCLTESSAGGIGTDDRVNMSILAVIASTGEVVYDDFIDSHLRTELEVRDISMRLHDTHELNNSTLRLGLLTSSLQRF